MMALLVDLFAKSYLWCQQTLNFRLIRFLRAKELVNIFLYYDQFLAIYVIVPTCSHWDSILRYPLFVSMGLKFVFFCSYTSR